ncbi:MAG: hypothetical protein ACRCT8_04380 [Lacipirellulaceae bacterium]
MSIAWNAAGDFAEVVDTLESVRLWRAGAASPGAWTTGWRFSQRTPAEGASALPPVPSKVVWQLPFFEGTAAPAPGDRLIDAAGGDWTLQVVERLRGSTRYRCEAVTTVAP